jgi:hypothetical protein|tara:strand:+ start:17915 stop:20080 length:2166 start_codon:yes stop_codon:yes gene_type:complete
MRKFLDTFPTVVFNELYKVYPEFNSMLNEIEEVGRKVKKGVSPEAEEQYEQLLDTLDSFLLRPESIDAYNKVYSFKIPLDKEILFEKKSLSLEERDFIEEELESEIAELMKGVDLKVIENITPEISQEIKTVGEEVVQRVREDFDEEDRFVGLSFKYSDFNKVKFEKILAMLGQGCKFYYTTYGSSFVLFKLKGMGRVIVQTSEEKRRYDTIFLPNSQELNVYILNDNKSTLYALSELFESAFDIVDDEPTILNDSFLYNTPYINASYEKDFLWKEADLVQQDKGLALRNSLIKKYFSLYNPLEGICVLQMCKEIYEKVNIDKNAQEKIENNIKEKKFWIEGIGNVEHSPNILQELQSQNLLDINYKLTPFGQGVISFNKDSRLILPQFRPFSYYMNDIKEEVIKSKNKYYSIFNGQTLYHTKKDVDKINFAINLNTRQRADWGVQKAEQVNSFPIAWQQNQDFKDYVQYLPFGSGGKLSIRKMKQAREQRELTRDKIMFRDLDRNELYIASTLNNGFVWAIDSQNYKYICSMYGEDNIRILGDNDNSSFSKEDFVFFMIVNDSNNILAVLPALSFKQKVEKVQVDVSGKILANQTELEFTTTYKNKSASDNPKPVWDVDDIMNDLEQEYPKFILEGKMIGEREDIVIDDAKDDAKDEDKNNDIIIDFDNPEEPIIIVEDEKDIKIKELNEELLVLEEFEQDEIISQEIKEIKEKLEALKN